MSKPVNEHKRSLLVSAKQTAIFQDSSSHLNKASFSPLRWASAYILLLARLPGVYLHLVA